MTDTRTPAPTTPLEVVTPMKPSEALRLGRLTRPDRSINLVEGTTRACALGAMHIAWGGNADEDGAYLDLDDTLARLSELGETEPYETIFGAFVEGGDAAVLAYLESRGL